jgi:hypothetical protein
VNHEEALIKSFIVPERQERYLSLLSSRKGREKFIERLAHDIGGEIDQRFARRIEGDARQVEAELKSAGAPETCYVLSEGELDRRVMSLSDALEEIVYGGMGSFVSCIPGKLAYFEGEEAGDRYLLRR